MDEDQNWWNLHLLRELFSHEEVEKICRLIPCPERQPDTLIWWGTQNGNFTVRSAYHLARELQERRRESSSTNRLVEEIWRKI
jgi:hypothetical protein